MSEYMGECSGIMISGRRAGEWISSSSTVWFELIPSAHSPRYFAESDPMRIPELQKRPYYLQRMNLFGREINIWVPDYAMKSEEAMNAWAIDTLLSPAFSRAMGMYSLPLPPETPARSA